VVDGEDVTAYFYDGVSNLVRTEFPNGVVETREYDELDRLLYLENTLDDSLISSYTYTLDKVGNRLSVEEQDGRLVEYDYDDLYRLVEEKITDTGSVNDGRVIGYTYDLVGNRLIRDDSLEGVTSYTYNENDWLLTEVTVNNGETVSVAYRYDDNGNTIARIKDGTEETTYIWDYENRLVEVKLPDGSVIGYVYDDEGIRVSTSVEGVTTHYLLDKNRPYAQVLEEYVAGELEVRYVYGHDLISQETEGETAFYQVDGLGSTRGLTDETGGIVQTYTYDGFGELIESTGEVENRYQFAGEQYDEGLDQYYLRQRYYDSEIGRFTRRDTFEGSTNIPLSLHKYLYTHANPVNHTDPSGLLILAQTVAVDIQIILVTGLVLQASSPSFIGLSSSQRQAMISSNYGHYIPLLEEDEDNEGCFFSNVPRRGASNDVINGIVESPVWFSYATQVTGSRMDFFVVTPNAVPITFDGLTPGTRDVWEAKYGYAHIPSNSFLTSRDLPNFERERNAQLEVANECGYNLQWAFSEESPAIHIRNQWNNIPPILHIPYV